MALHYTIELSHAPSANARNRIAEPPGIRISRKKYVKISQMDLWRVIFAVLVFVNLVSRPL